MDEPRPAVTSVVRGVLAVLLAAVVAGCSGGRGAAPALSGLHPSREHAAQAVVDAMAAGDLPLLERLALDGDEFRDIVWPALPASDPVLGMPAGYVWAETRARSLGSLAELLEERRGRGARVLAVRFAGASSRHDGFTVHRDTRVRVRTGDGRESDLRLFGSMLETTAGWKVYSYVVD